MDLPDSRTAADHPPTLRARPPDPSKSETVTVIRATRAKLTKLSLRRLREDVFRLQLSLLQQMVEGGVDPARIAAVANTAKVIETIEVLGAGARER